jgi:hypothetical protein
VKIVVAIIADKGKRKVSKEVDNHSAKKLIISGIGYSIAERITVA